MSKRIYVISILNEIENIKQEVLVKASSAAQAVRFCADPMFDAEVATQDDLVRLAKTHNVKEA